MLTNKFATPSRNTIITFLIEIINPWDCDTHYIGQTGRTFQERFKEHIASKKHENNRAALAEHLVDNLHSRTSIKESMSVFHKLNKENTIKIIEECEIYRHDRLIFLPKTEFCIK